MIYELIIIGGGPAGAAAGVYAARKQIKTLLITENFGGQSVESTEIQNWIGNIAISGADLAKNLKEHVKFYAGGFVNIKEGEKVVRIEMDKDFLVTTNKENYRAKTILVATGSSRKRLDIPGAKKFEGKGITYCASCDGPFFAGKDVAVIGGGNAGFETAAQLLAYCKSVTILTKGQFHADPATVEKVLTNPKVTAVTNALPVEINGDQFVKSLVYQKTAPFMSNVEIMVEGIFVEIGHEPITSFVRDLVDLNEFGHIKVDHKNQRSSCPGIWAAGDCADGLYHQNNIAAGDATKALEDIYLELQRMK